jgi:hypothetical protein
MVGLLSRTKGAETLWLAAVEVRCQLGRPPPEAPNRQLRAAVWVSNGQLMNAYRVPWIT